MIFVSGNPAGQGLPERAGLLKKDYRQAFSTIETVCKDETDSNTSSSNYWSSTENSNNNAFNVNFNNGNVNNNKSAVLFSFFDTTILN